MALTHACVMQFGKYKGKSVEALALTMEGYAFLGHFSKARISGEDEFASLRRFVRRVLDLGDRVNVVQTCACGKHPAAYALYYAQSAMIFEKFCCEKCRPAAGELGLVYQLVPLRFSSQLRFGDMHERERFVEFLVRAVGLSRPITARKAFAFFFPAEAAEQAEALRKQVPKPVAMALGLI